MTFAYISFRRSFLRASKSDGKNANVIALRFANRGIRNEILLVLVYNPMRTIVIAELRILMKRGLFGVEPRDLTENWTQLALTSDDVLQRQCLPNFVIRKCHDVASKELKGHWLKWNIDICYITCYSCTGCISVLSTNYLLFYLPGGCQWNH